MEFYQHLIILIANFLVYFVSFLFIIVKREKSAISVRSPILLILNNLGGFLMTSIFISYEMIEDLVKITLQNNNYSSLYIDTDNFKLFCKIFPNNYLVCHFLMMISFILRCHRIIQCCKINYDERVEINEFYNKRYLFKERYYLKILFSFMMLVIFINFILNLQFSKSDFNLIPYNFRGCMSDPKRAQYYVGLMWVIINFIEDLIIVTYTYKIFINPIKQMIKVELLLFMLVWIVYPNVLRFCDFILDLDGDQDSHITSYICCIFLWICLILNGYLPVIYSYFQDNSNIYHFNTKLSNNLYLFLSSEQGFYSFYDYVREKDDCRYYLNLYVAIIKYKLKYTIEPDYYKVYEECKTIYEKYFAHIDRNYLDIDTINKVKSNCQMLNKEECTYDMFDDALVISYEHLLNTFKNYKRSEEYQILVDNLNLNSYIQCKMCNTGLISKY